MARVRVENSRSRPRSSVTLATTATRIAGTAAITANRPTIRTCSRAAARPRRRACTTSQTSRAMMPSSRNTVSALISSSVTTTAVGGRDRRQVGQHDEGREGRQQRQHRRDRAQARARPGPAAGAAISAGVVWSTLAMLVIEPLTSADGAPPWRPPARRVPLNRPTDAFIQQCCRIETYSGARACRPRIKSLTGRYGAGRLAAGADHLDIQVADLLAQACCG